MTDRRLTVKLDKCCRGRHSLACLLLPFLFWSDAVGEQAVALTETMLPGNHTLSLDFVPFEGRMDAFLEGQVQGYTFSIHHWNAGSQIWESLHHERDSGWNGDWIRMKPGQPLIVSISEPEKTFEAPFVFTVTGVRPQEFVQTILPGLNLIAHGNPPEIFWHFSYEPQAYEIPLEVENSFSMTPAKFHDVSYDAKLNEVVLKITTTAETPHRVDLVYRDQAKVNVNPEKISWSLLHSGLEISEGEITLIRDRGEADRPHPREVYRRIYEIRPFGSDLSGFDAGLEENVSAETNMEPEEVSLTSDWNIAADTEEDSAEPKAEANQTQAEWEPLTRDQADELVSSEFVLREKLARNAVNELLAVPARRAWQLDRGGHLLFLRQVSSPTPSDIPRQSHENTGLHLVPFDANGFDPSGITAKERRVEMVVADVLDQSISQVQWRDESGLSGIWQTPRDFALLEGVRIFTYAGVHWTIFVIATSLEERLGEVEPLDNSDVEPPTQTLEALVSHYDDQLEGLKREHEHKRMLREARNAWLKANPPQPRNRVINFWKVEGR